MKIMSVGKFKAHFSQVLKKVQAGEEIDITYGKNKEVVATLISKTGKKGKRKLGVLETKGKVKFSRDFKMTTEEFLES